MVEPAITWGSSVFYRLPHQEPVDMSTDPLVEGAPNPRRDPYESNQAIPTLLATKDRDRFLHLFPSFGIDRVEWFSFLAYPLSGDSSVGPLIPAGLVPRLLDLERRLEPMFGRWMAFRYCCDRENWNTLKERGSRSADCARRARRGYAGALHSRYHSSQRCRREITIERVSARTAKSLHVAR